MLGGFSKGGSIKFFLDPDGDAVGWGGRQVGPVENFPGF